MDSFFGIGFPELVLILLLAGLVLGPGRIRVVARTIGKMIVQLQAISRDFAKQLDSELDQIDKEDIRGALDDVRALRNQVNDLQHELKRNTNKFLQEGRGSEIQKTGDEEIHASWPPNGTPPAVFLPKLLDVDDDPER